MKLGEGVDPTNYIEGMLTNPDMYVSSRESLEAVYWAMNAVRGSSKTAKRLIFTKTGVQTSLSKLNFRMDKMIEIYKQVEVTIKLLSLSGP